MKTIKVKMFLLFSTLMVCMVLGGIILYTLFLEPYYIYKNKGVFIETNRFIRDTYRNQRDHLVENLEYIDRMKGINTIITDANYNIKYSSFPLRGDRRPPLPGKDQNGDHRPVPPTGNGLQRLPREMEQLGMNNKDTLSKTDVFAIVEQPDSHERELVLISKIGENELIVLQKPLKGIRESVAIAHQFYLLVGLVIIICGGILILAYSGKLTKPIIEMSKVAEGIANLEFEQRVVYDFRDEIGQLAGSINKIAEKLSASISELKQDVERRKQLVRNMSHELKTPIGVIKGYAEGLKYGVAGDKENMVKYCGVIAEECDRMDSMIRELLNLSALESGTFQLNISRFDLGEFMQNVSEQFMPILMEKGISMDLRCEPHLMITADYELLERVVNNYLTNAIHYTEGEKRIRVTAGRQNSGIRISVFNTGKTIPPNDLENLWDVFYKGDKARSRQYGGHGLGLSIVKSITGLHGGGAGVENLPDGVMFYIDLPFENDLKSC